MQALDVVSVNLWQILISLVNLLLIFLIVKKVLFAPVQRMLSNRQSQVDERYAAAEAAEKKARQDQADWEEKMQSAQEEAAAMLKNAADGASRRREAILTDAKERADGIVRQAQAQAELEKQKAAADMKHEIVDVSAALTEKMLSREIREEDHRALFESFLENIGDDDDIGS